jgi:hypothetical protein
MNAAAEMQWHSLVCRTFFSLNAALKIATRAFLGTYLRPVFDPNAIRNLPLIASLRLNERPEQEETKADLE